ncbi:MAG: ribosome-recycling factor, partial [Candidatus Peribacteraceae bacterium]|nr:ribosome-recycling factor [Candidatus Peribacteraceae bacterium]
MLHPRLVAFAAETDKVIKFLQAEYGKLQTGRANVSLVEHLEVEAYGQRQQLRSVAGISVQDARTIVIQPWDKSVMTNVEKALQIASLGCNPVNDGHAIRLTLPPMNE